MSNILAITPISIAGTLIMKGLIKGFEQLGHNVLVFDVRELNAQLIANFCPDFVIGYDYLHFIHPNAEKIVKELNIPVIHYFADAPDSVFSHSGDLELFNKLSNSDGIVFCWDKECLKTFKNKALYLPLGVDPELYQPQENNLITSEIVFAGRPLTHTRINVLCDIIRNFPDKLSIYSYKKHFETSVKEIEETGLLEPSLLENYKNSYKGFLEKEQDLANIYAGAKIVLNITMDQGLSSMNYRVLEVLGSGGFLLTDQKQDTLDYFEDNIELVTYKNNIDLINKISKYLQDDSLRAQIAQNGKNKVIKYHTFEQRAGVVLENI